MSGTEETEIDLDQLITNRMNEKREELEQKRHHELRTIRDRRDPGVNHDPFPEGAFERLQSNNVWEKVLGFLNEPGDVTSAYFACRTFANILEKRRVLLLLPEVLNDFKTNVDNAFEGSKDDRKTGTGKRENWKRICLDTRGVCKDWKEIAEFHLFDSDFTKNDWFLWTDWMDSGTKRGFAKTCVFTNEESVDRAQSALLTPLSMRIRSISVKMDDRQTPTGHPFPTKVIEFLRVHGRSVWFFTFKCSDWNGFRNPAEVYDRLCDMLELLPNLKSFILDVNRRWGEVGMEEAFANFRRRLDQRPIPVLPSLEHFWCYEGVYVSLFRQVLRKSINLKFVGHSFTGDAVLMGLTLECYDCLGDAIISNQCNWPLKYLTLDRVVFRLQVFEASLLFPAINRFRETLQVLRILDNVKMDARNIPKFLNSVINRFRETLQELRIFTDVKMDSTNVHLDLPHLKEIRIYNIDEGMMGFDEMLNLKSLEYISVASVKYEKEDAKVKVKEYLRSGDMKESNLWKCFPNLKRLRVGSEPTPLQLFPDIKIYSRK